MGVISLQEIKWTMEFHVDSVRLSVMTGVFRRHCLQETENAVLLSISELEAVIFDIFFATQKENSLQISVDLSTSLVVLSVKAALVILSSAKLQEKYEYLFRQLADHNSCVSANGLEKLLNAFAHVFVYLNESTAFGFEQIASTLDSCFQQASGFLQ
ncbi:Dystrophin [Blattella germanica]|nr:Dystrophin [Blattella germanica]